MKMYLDYVSSGGNNFPREINLCYVLVSHIANIGEVFDYNFYGRLNFSFVFGAAEHLRPNRQTLVHYVVLPSLRSRFFFLCICRTNLVVV